MPVATAKASNFKLRHYLLVLCDPNLSTLKGALKTTKHLMAEQLISEGKPVQILTEEDWWALCTELSLDPAETAAAAPPNIEKVLTDLAKLGCRITLFPVMKGRKATGQYQVNVGTVTGAGWICETDANPVQALITAGQSRLRVDYVPPEGEATEA